MRIIIIGLALFGTYKLFPQVNTSVDYYLQNPSFQSGFVAPSVRIANKVLPPKLQIPTPKVMGVTTDLLEPPLKSLTDEVANQVSSIAATLVRSSTEAVSEQFCTMIIEKIRTECGQ